MPMPNFEEIMLPLLRRVQDGRRYKYSDVLDDLRAHFGLSNSDYSEIRNQGGEPKFKNKTEWAKKDLMEAGLLEGLRSFGITDRGRSVLAESPRSIDRDFLKRFPEFRAYLQRSREKAAAGGEELVRAGGTGVRQSDLVKRLKVEQSAIEAVAALWNQRGYAVNSVERDNVGWDLDVRRRREFLRVEVKGNSGTDPLAELTPNEYSNMKRFTSSYRLCIVTDALA